LDRTKKLDLEELKLVSVSHTLVPLSNYGPTEPGEL